MNLLQFPTLNHRCDITGGVREADCRGWLQKFFARQGFRPRRKGRKTKRLNRVGGGVAPRHQRRQSAKKKSELLSKNKNQQFGRNEHNLWVS